MTAVRLIVILGSGEIAPGMVPVHRRILERVRGGRGVIVDTPFGFQENADELTAKIRRYFEHHLDRSVEVASLRDNATATAVDKERFAAAIEAADYVFAGPGSPSYALRQWRDTPLADLLRAKVGSGGVITFASAAAITLGVVALPVYEIYKVGEAPHWLPGLDILSAAGLRCAVLPHFDNTEGGTHDTRFCFLGERRLVELEAMLAPGTLILGVDEHTAVILDLEAGTVAVQGRGAMTIRRDGSSWRIGAGEVVALAELQSASGPTDRPPLPPGKAAEVSVAGVAGQVDAAFAAADIDAIIAGLLELDSRTQVGDDLEAARAALRRRIVRLGELARVGSANPREKVAPFVDALLALRGSARDARRFDEADMVRGLLDTCGVEVRDTPDGVEWRLATPASR